MQTDREVEDVASDVRHPEYYVFGVTEGVSIAQ